MFKKSKAQFPLFDTSCCCAQSLDFSEQQIDAYLKLKHKCSISFDEMNPEHKSQIDHLFNTARNIKENHSLSIWEVIGFQTSNPATDFRGGGLISLKCINSFFQTHRKHVIKIIEGENNFLLAAASINCTFFLEHYFHLKKGNFNIVCSEPQFKKFCTIIAESQENFYEVNSLLLLNLFYDNWLPNKRQKNHSLMEFNYSFNQAIEKFAQTFKEKWGFFSDFKRLYTMTKDMYDKQ